MGIPHPICTLRCTWIVRLDSWSVARGAYKTARHETIPVTFIAITHSKYILKSSMLEITNAKPSPPCQAGESGQTRLLSVDPARGLLLRDDSKILVFEFGYI